MARRSYQSVIEEIKNKCDIADVVSQVVQLKRTGSNQKGLCPFHSEKTPSFVISDSRQRFTCFGCGASGDVIEFVRRYYNLSFPEAVERLALMCGVDIPDSYESGGKSKEIYYEINRRAARFFFDALSGQANPALTYMIKRGIEPATLKAFGVGYADGEWNSLTEELDALGFESKMLLELGLVSEKNDRRYDRFRSRVMFPIINTRGKVIGFGGRILGPGEPKYLNSQESFIFQKKNNLFGLNLTKGSIQKEEYAILVEGYTDVLSLYQCGVRNVAASLGTALTAQQAKLLKRYTDKIVLCYDSDQAGIDAALRGSDVLRREGLFVRIVNVPDGKDPDAFVQKNGRDAFLDLIGRRSVSDTDYKISLLEKKYDLNNTDQSVRFLQEVVEVLRSLPPVEADLYIGKIAKEYRVSEGALRRETQKELLKQSSGLRAQTSTHTSDLGDTVIDEAGLRLERMLLRLVLLRSEYIEGLKEYPEAMLTPAGMRILNAFQNADSPEDEIDPKLIIDTLDEEASVYLSDIMREVRVGEKDEDAYADCIAKLQDRRLEKRKAEIISLLSAAEASGDQARSDDLMKEFMTIQQTQQR